MPWMDDYESAKRNTDRATRWAGGAGEPFPMQPEKLHPTTSRTLSQSQFGPTTREAVNRPGSEGYERIMMSTVSDQSTDSVMRDAQSAQGRLREFSQFDESSPPTGTSRQEQVDNEIVSRLHMGSEGRQYTGSRGVADMLRETRRQITENPLRHGRN